jgi:hypothetical protein
VKSLCLELQLAHTIDLGSDFESRRRCPRISRSTRVSGRSRSRNVGVNEPVFEEDETGIDAVGLIGIVLCIPRSPINGNHPDVRAGPQEIRSLVRRHSSRRD